ncbi:MAG: hypothetical protein ACW99U_05155 [Candidatus Thorarchaeota archaeon]|jgi:hypothetical protein
MMDRLSGKLFGLKKVGKYLTDSELRKAYAEYKESEETALRLIVNTALSEGWIISLSQPRTIEQLAAEQGYSNMPLLEQVLTLLTNENMISFDDNMYSIKQIKTTPIRPEDVGTVLTNFYFDCARYLPDALRGHTVPLEQVPRIVLETVFSSPLTEIGRGVLLRSFSSKGTKGIGVAAFADIGLPYALRQINEIFNPETIHLFLHDYRWLVPITSILRLLSGDAVLEKITTDLIGRKVDLELDLFYGEELFAFAPETASEKVKLISNCLKPGGKLITNDPTIEAGHDVSTPAYVLMRTIEGYPQPLRRDVIQHFFEAGSLRVQTIGENWVIAEKMGDV